MRRAQILRMALACAAILLAANAAAAQGLTKVTIALTSGSIPASGVRVAKEMRLFEKNGIDAQISIMDSGSVAMMGLLSGSVDFYSGAMTDAILGQAQGQDVVSIAPIYRGFGGSLVLAKSVADRLGVTAGSPLNDKLKALNGLLIASPSASSTYTLSLEAAAALAGSKVKFTYMSQPAMVAALKTGAIQGMMVGAPFYAQAEIAGTGVTLLSGPKGEFPPDTTASYAVVLNAKRAYALAHPDIVAKMDRVFTALANATKERPDEVKAAIGRLFPELDAKTLDVIFSAESHGFMTSPLTEADVAHDISYLRGNGIKFNQPDRVTPQNILFK